MRSAVERAWRREPWLGLLVAIAALLDTLASLLRYAHYQSGIDLGIFDQAVWHYSHLQAPFSSIKSEDLLGDHFHPIVALLAPLYWIWSSPRMLLLAQALLVAASIVPVFLYARGRLGRLGAYLLAVAYAGFWGLQVGVLFDFHELAFAPLLIACAVLSADRRRWPWFWVAIVLLLGVKEDLGPVVAFFGLYLLARGERRRAALLVVIGIGWYELATRVFIPHFAGPAGFTYWTYNELGRNAPEALWALVKEPWRLVTIALSPDEKAHTLLALFAPFLFLSLGSPLAILAIPLLAERLLSTNPNYWSTHYHYSLSIAPVLAMAAADGLTRVSRLLPERERTRVVRLALGVMLLASVALTRSFSYSAVTVVTSGSSYTAPAAAAGAGAALAAVPAGASVAAPDTLLAHLSQRNTVDPINAASVRRDQYVVFDALDSGCCADNALDSSTGQVIDAVLPELTPVAYANGWVVARGPADGRPGAEGVLQRMPASRAAVVARAAYGWRTALLGAIQDVGVCDRRLLGGGQAAACFGGIAQHFGAAQSALTGAITATLPTLTEGCRQLAAAARTAGVRVAGNVEAIASAGSRPSPQALVGVRDAYLRFTAAEAVGDRAGVIARFVILCSPPA